MINQSRKINDNEWYVVQNLELEKSEGRIGQRYQTFSFSVVALAGFFDGINPCAFATIIFFLSYLQVARRSAKQILQIGAAFILGVFIAYFLLGLGLVEFLVQISVIKLAGIWLNRFMILLSFIIMCYCIYDGILCAQGKLEDIKLQLPDFFKKRIRKTIRTGVKHRNFIIAAFVIGVIISFLELACTGQVYAPTILFMLKTGANRLGALSYLCVYNLCFIFPLLIIFVFAYFGLNSEILTKILKEKAVFIKFGTAVLFLALLLFLIVQEVGTGI